VSVGTVTTHELAMPEGESAIGPLDNRFHVVAVASLRVMQIRNGARLRLDLGGHKPCVVAVAEVLAGTVPYYIS
jgi:DNA-directed RNA polymerase subunit K/omega